MPPRIHEIAVRLTENGPHYACSLFSSQNDSQVNIGHSFGVGYKSYKFLFHYNYHVVVCVVCVCISNVDRPTEYSKANVICDYTEKTTAADSSSISVLCLVWGLSIVSYRMKYNVLICKSLLVDCRQQSISQRQSGCVCVSNKHHSRMEYVVSVLLPPRTQFVHIAQPQQQQQQQQWHQLQSQQKTN